ncbi:hypothetical protein, conserved [Trypanosoma brucei brucei TREU927]|uniref:Uncharacterized protein n=1 Tax=Trypanosoma brucei brucei (strain 927/4 GUTat10.1) TaxID=185431 RepID=Q38BN8_TRYB2|nr:hypothetical protein, conserved [Trypanosoma brucei brucei TREU927]EAN77782.1 hypothetical protein, conserved [Trypanosoma brucei brucei TREU927]
MAVGAGVRQRAAAAARHWRRVSVKTLRSRLSTPHVCDIKLPLISNEAPVGSGPALNIRLGTNNEEIMRWCQLEYFGFLKPADAATDSHTSNTSDVCIHSGPPGQLGYPYALTAEVDNFTDAVRRDEESAEWQNISGAESAHPSRWLTQLLLDGFISRRVAAHVGLSADHLMDTVRMARQLKVPLAPSEVSPHYFSNDLLSTWGVFGELKSGDTDFVGDYVHRVLQLAHASSVISACHSVWLKGTAICNGNGGAVIILGPRASGKTTLALHCLATSTPKIRLIGLEHFHIAPESVIQGASISSGGARALLMSIPSPASVGIGALIGSLKPNPSLVEAAHTFTCSAATINSLMRNSEETIWFMGRRHVVNINEAFGPHRWCPTWFGTVKGIVLLNWDVHELSRPTSSAGTQIIHWTEKEDCFKALNAFATNAGAALFKGHYLIRSMYNELNAHRQLEEMLFSGGEVDGKVGVPPIFEVRGAVHFDAVVKLICDRLLNETN